EIVRERAAPVAHLLVVVMKEDRRRQGGLLALEREQRRRAGTAPPDRGVGRTEVDAASHGGRGDGAGRSHGEWPWQPGGRACKTHYYSRPGRSRRSRRRLLRAT